MGLTIHYQLKTKLESIEDVRNLLKGIRSKCLDLPFEDVSDIIELEGEAARVETYRNNDALTDEESFAFEMAISASRSLSIRKVQTGPNSYTETFADVHPLKVIGFSAWPGPGCESMNIYLAQYPKTIEWRWQERKTRIHGWLGQGFTKTQYANDPRAGGTPNFIRCHLCVVKALEVAKKMGMIVKVSDEGGYWKNRRKKDAIKNLVAEVGSWDQMIAAYAGAFRDAVGNVETAMDGRPDFESLEFHGANSIENLNKLKSIIKSSTEA